MNRAGRVAEQEDARKVGVAGPMLLVLQSGALARTFKRRGSFANLGEPVDCEGDVFPAGGEPSTAVALWANEAIVQDDLRSTSIISWQPADMKTH